MLVIPPNTDSVEILHLIFREYKIALTTQHPPEAFVVPLREGGPPPGMQDMEPSSSCSPDYCSLAAEWFLSF